MSIADSGYTSHMVNSLSNMTNLREVETVVKKGNKKTMTGSLRVDWKENQKIGGKLYPMTCTEISYIPDLSENCFQRDMCIY